jgi:malate dehydrogenase (quinone)
MFQNPTTRGHGSGPVEWRPAGAEWQTKLHQIVPSYGTKLNDSPEAVAKEWAYTAEILQLPTPPVIPQVAAPKATEAAKPAAEPSKPASDLAL